MNFVSLSLVSHSMKIYKKLSVSMIILLMISLKISGQTMGEARFDSVYTGYFRINSGGWTAGDATISVPLPDGRVIWLFGDSYTVNVNTTNNTLPCLFQVRNCFMVQDSVNPAVFRTILDTTQTGVNRTTFKLRPNDTSIFWPGHGYVYNDSVYIFQERYKSANLDYEGCYIARLTYPELHQVPMQQVIQVGADHFMGRAVLVDSAENRLYVYGNKLNWIVWEPVLARCDLSNPFLPWEFYTGIGWSAHPTQAQKICNDPVSPGFSVFKRNSKYYLVTQENGYLECGLGRDIYSYVSDNPWGPFTGKTLLYTEESKFNGSYLLTYNAQAHPWNIENDELLVCYNVNDRVDTLAPYICPSQCKDIWTDRLDADTYRPKFIRVPMGLITSDGADRDKIAGGCPEVKMAPQPVGRGDAFKVELNAGKTRVGKIRITDVSGRVILTRVTDLTPANGALHLTAPPQSGIYFLEFTGDSGCGKVVKLVVR